MLGIRNLVNVFGTFPSKMVPPDMPAILSDILKYCSLFVSNLAAKTVLAKNFRIYFHDVPDQGDDLGMSAVVRMRLFRLRKPNMWLSRRYL